ncbi:MAG: UTP--glucose-1-phosphate uridylyltransferase, partial [Lachnospiraceae bacterium]|nr:UTP--glucose-1-phosphate uridylyltransferase [Lachnospiraceae bacterium]
MTYSEAYLKLEQAGQTHLLAFYDTLTEEEQESLLTQIEKTDLSVTRYIGRKDQLQKWITIAPLPALEIPAIEAERDRFERIGLEAIRRGEAAAVLLAGGMGTRLGSDAPKCMYDIGLTRHVYIMQRLIENLREVTDRAGAEIPFLIMTSDRNHEQTVSFMEEHDFFGYPKEKVVFFRQDMAPAADYDGKILLESPSSLALSPNGNGGWFESMERAGILAGLKEQGVKWLNVFGVDNVLQRIADPCFIGAVIDRGCESGAKAVRKADRNEKVGALCLEDGHPAIIEYYEMSDELLDAADEKGNPLYNFGVILNYLFRIDALERTLGEDFPTHVVEKKIACIDRQGRSISPEAPNGYKFEKLMIDQIRS